MCASVNLSSKHILFVLMMAPRASNKVKPYIGVSWHTHDKHQFFVVLIDFVGVGIVLCAICLNFSTLWVAIFFRKRQKYNNNLKRKEKHNTEPHNVAIAIYIDKQITRYIGLHAYPATVWLFGCV